MKTILQLLILILAAVSLAQLFTRFWQPPPKELTSALEIRDIEPPTQPQKRETPARPAAPPLSAPAPYDKSSASPKQLEPTPLTKILEAVPFETPPPLTDQEIYALVSGAVIQIFCAATEELFSASGVILNERGLVLTNAHVAEIVKKVGEKNCQARHGNPADPFAKIELVYIASTTPKIPGTPAPGVPQRDFAFLRITEAKESFSYAAIDITRVPQHETLLTLGYPSEFLQSINTSRNSNLVFSALSVAGYADVDGDLNTAEGYVFKGGLILQQGSSGTALFTRSGKVVGLIFATTKGATTADRDGIALMTGYINKILKIETGEGLMEFIANH